MINGERNFSSTSINLKKGATKTSFVYNLKILVKLIYNAMNWNENWKDDEYESCEIVLNNYSLVLLDTFIFGYHFTTDDESLHWR